MDKGYLSERYKNEELVDYLTTPSFESPEVSDKDSQGWGYVIATSTMNFEDFKYPTGQTESGSLTHPKGPFLNMTDAVSFSILHGMGHNAGIYHEIPGFGFVDGGDQGFMDEGGNLRTSIASFKGNISAFIKDTASKHPSVIQKLQNRFKPIKNP